MSVFFFSEKQTLVFHSRLLFVFSFIGVPKKRTFKSQEDFCFKDRKNSRKLKNFWNRFQNSFFKDFKFFWSSNSNNLLCNFFTSKNHSNKQVRSTWVFLKIRFFLLFIPFGEFGIKERKNALGIFFAFLLFECFFRFPSLCFFVCLHQHMFWDETKPSCFKKRQSFFEKHKGPC